MSNFAKIVMATGKAKNGPEKLKTVYRDQKGNVVRVTRGTNLLEAGQNVQRNLSLNKFKGAALAEVLDADTEQLYYSQKRSPATGKLSAPHYEWSPEDTVNKYAISALLKDA